MPLSVELKNTIVPKSGLKATIKSFGLELKKLYPDHAVITFARDISDTHAEVISIPVSEKMSQQEIAEIDHKILELMKAGFQPASESTVKISGDFKKMDFEKTISFDNLKPRA